MTDIPIMKMPANAIFRGYGFSDKHLLAKDGPLALYFDWEEQESGALHHTVVVPDYTQPTGFKVEDTVVTVSPDFTISVGTLDDTSERP